MINRKTGLLKNFFSGAGSMFKAPNCSTWNNWLVAKRFVNGQCLLKSAQVYHNPIRIAMMFHVEQSLSAVNCHFGHP